MERKNVVLLTVIAVATLLTAMVGSTFAFFTATVSGEGGTKDVVNAQTISQVTATYSEGSKIGVTGAAITPTWTGAKTITITNGNDAAIDFTISFAEYTNTGFENLQYKLEKGDGTASSIEGTTTSEDDNFVKMETGSTLKAEGATTTFTLTFRLKDTGADQTEADSNGSFSGKLEASAHASKITE